MPNLHDIARIGLSDNASTKARTRSQELLFLKSEVDRLRRRVEDLEIELITSNEHSDNLQDHFYRISASLAAEVKERQAAEEKLQKLVQTISREKGDLEILVQILNDQGDVSAEESEQARIDGLTRIANRRRFEEYLLGEWNRHTRLHQQLALILCDVDHFKRYNDHYGHLAGDECLRRVASSISQAVRPGDLVARYGGEEFAIVLPQIGELAIPIAERVRAAMESEDLPHAYSQVSNHVTLSVGVAWLVPPAQVFPDARELIELADRGLYQAKRNGRNRVSCYEEEFQR